VRLGVGSVFTGISTNSWSRARGRGRSRAPARGGRLRRGNQSLHDATCANCELLGRVASAQLAGQGAPTVAR
jgi:hypothetical protein